MRNPNGFGGVTKLSGKRRKPYRARVTIGFDEKKQVYKTVGYYEKRKDAIEALSDYQKNPAVFDAAKITFSDVYDLWSIPKYKTISASNVNGYKASYVICDTIKKMRMSDIKTAHLQAVVDNSGKNYPTLRKLKVLLSQVYIYAMQNDIVEKNYAEYIDIKKNQEYEGKLTRTPFSEDEIEMLWENLSRHDWMDTILIQIYTGMRIGELLSMLSEDVNLTAMYMRGGSKTTAGKHRVIPLHDRIIPLIEKRLSANGNHLIVKNCCAISYFTYRDSYWKNAMEQLQMNHLPHDCRHTFASRADTAGMNKLCIKRIMGHASTDITDKVYTHKEIQELITEVNKLI